MNEKMYEYDSILLFQENYAGFKPSELQRKFLEESSYNILSQGGKKIQRTYELLVFNALSGKILIKKKVSCNDDKCNKSYILVGNAETENAQAGM
ncbi:MAG: hypothetical protein GX568_10540 [Candidatus Gastranaerophilales bacterium]|jgi:hypothetical protein|nr:hypothetical protein [Candidatus Gastranaerophilales bacterium]